MTARPGRTSRLRVTCFSAERGPDDLAAALDEVGRRIPRRSGRGSAVTGGWRLALAVPSVPSVPPVPPVPPRAVPDPGGSAGSPPCRAVVRTAPLYPPTLPRPRWLTSVLVAGDAIPPAALDEVRRVLGGDQAVPSRVHDQHATARGVRADDVVQVYLARRPAGMSRTTFEQRYRAHRDVVLAHEPLFHRYLVTVATGEGHGWDGFSEQWFSSRARRREHQLRLADDARSDVRRDVQQFIGASDPLRGVLDDHVGDAGTFLGLVGPP